MSIVDSETPWLNRCYTYPQARSETTMALWPPAIQPLRPAAERKPGIRSASTAVYGDADDEASALASTQGEPSWSAAATHPRCGRPMACTRYQS